MKSKRITAKQVLAGGLFEREFVPYTDDPALAGTYKLAKGDDGLLYQLADGFMIILASPATCLAQLSTVKKYLAMTADQLRDVCRPGAEGAAVLNSGLMPSLGHAAFSDAGDPSGESDLLSRSIAAKEFLLATREQERLARVAREEERKREQEEARISQLEGAASEFVSGKEIGPRAFADLCDQFGIVIPLRSRGFLLNTVSSIHKSGYKAYSATKSRPLFHCMSALVAAIEAKSHD